MVLQCYMLLCPCLYGFQHYSRLPLCFLICSVLLGCFGFKGPLRQYFSLYRAVSEREGERGESTNESKNVQTTRTYCKRNRPPPYCYQNCRTPRHWKFTQHHRTTRPPLVLFCNLKQKIGKIDVTAVYS